MRAGPFRFGAGRAAGIRLGELLSRVIVFAIATLRLVAD